MLEDVETEEKKEYKMTVENQELTLDFNINENDKILMLKFQGGQKFFMLSKI